MKKLLLVVILFAIVPVSSAFGAYHHGADTDSDIVLDVYPAIGGTKLDSCALCHTGGEYEKRPGVVISMGSCQWCHYSYGYDQSGDINSTLNDYGKDYLVHGKSPEALAAIEANDSDMDGYSNRDEIAALRFPGSAADDPSKVPAPYRIVTRDELETMPSHCQLMLMNTHKSGDFYTEYCGTTMADLLDDSGVLNSATGITVYAPDGWAQYHPLDPDSDPLMYHVYGGYPQADFFHVPEADKAMNPDYGWCDYSSPAAADLDSCDENLSCSPIEVENGLRMLLAYTRDSEYLISGELSDENRLDGEGPFRVVPPQKLVGPPDQSVKSDMQDVTWPFDEYADHNAGFATRSATVIKVEPLPAGTTDIDTLEAGWNYVDENKILIYGALDPYDTIVTKLSDLKKMVRSMDRCDFKNRSKKRTAIQQIRKIKKSFVQGRERAFQKQLNKLSSKFDGCQNGSGPDKNDWITNCDSQLSVYWALNEVKVLSDIEEGCDKFMPHGF